MSGISGESPAVRVEHLWKSFGGHEVLKDVNLDVDPGQVVVVFGRSGSGKSTLLRCINFLEEPSEGTIEVAGIRIPGGGHRTRAKRERIRQVRIRTGMVFQDFNLFPHRTALQNVTEGPVDRAREVCARRRGDGPRAPRDGGAARRRPTSTRSSSRAASSNGSRSPARWR